MSGKYNRQGTVTATDVVDVTSIGSSLRRLKCRKVEFDHDKATWLLELTDFPGDRSLKQRHVDDLVVAMRRGTFMPEFVILITCKLDGDVYRMNGQHTAWARLEMPEDWPCEVKLMEYEATSEQDMRQLYASIDRSSPRTKANVIESYLAGSDEFKDVKQQVLRVLPQGFALWHWPTTHERSKHDGDEIAYYLKTEFYDLAMKVAGLIGKCSLREQGHMFRASVVAAMYATAHKAPDIAKRFWGPVADGVGIENRGDPRLKLRTYLMQTAVGVGRGGASDKAKVSQELMFRQCIVAWNAYRANKTLQVLRGNERGKRSAVK